MTGVGLGHGGPGFRTDAGIIVAGEMAAAFHADIIPAGRGAGERILAAPILNVFPARCLKKQKKYD
jgi:hypothetical protein